MFLSENPTKPIINSTYKLHCFKSVSYTHLTEFFNDAPSTYFTILPGEFAIFFPGDGHAPLIGEGETKKIIIKVAVM